MSNREGNSRVVWIIDERLLGEIQGAMGAFYTSVKYHKGGMEYEALLENDEFILMEDWIGYDID